MKNNRLRKKDKVVNNLIFVVIVVVVLVAKFLPGVVHYWQSSEVYKKYSRVEGVKATYIKDYRLNDTLTVGVTLLEATDSAGWAYLCGEFNILPGMIEAAEEDSTTDVWTRKILKGHPESPYKKSDANHQEGETEPVIEILSLSIRRQEVCIFHTRNNKECDEAFVNRINANL